jgi:hypothetical protein
VTEVLDLSKIFDRSTVKIGPKTYELRNREEFSLLQFEQLAKLLNRAAELEAAGHESDEAIAEAASLMRDLTTLLIVDLDVEIPDLACVVIVSFWRDNQPNLYTNETPQKPRSRTTVASSRGSKRSTAATRKPGSQKSPAGR